MEVLQGKKTHEEWVGWFGRQPSFLWSLSPSRTGSRFPQHAELGFAEIMQLRIVY